MSRGALHEVGLAALHAAQSALRRPRPGHPPGPQAHAAHRATAAALRPREEARRQARRCWRSSPRSTASEPNRENIYALAELAYVGGKKAEVAMRRTKRSSSTAQPCCTPTSICSTRLTPRRATPTTRSSASPAICTTRALEGTLRIVQSQGALRPARRASSRPPTTRAKSKIVLKSKGWHAEDFDHVEFVSDFEVHGLRNHYHNFGLGVPLIAVRRHHEDMDPREQYLPARFVVPDHRVPAAGNRSRACRSSRATSCKRRPRASQTMRQPPRASRPTPPRTAAHVHAVLEFYDPLGAQQGRRPRARRAAGNRPQHAAGPLPQPAGARRKPRLHARPACTPRRPSS